MLAKGQVLKTNVFHLFLIMVCFFISSTAFSAPPLYGFTVGKEPINPVRIHKMRPWISDNEILIKSVNLKACHNSNWSSHPKPVVIEKSDISPKITFVYTDNDDKKDSEWDRASYNIIGKTEKGTFVLIIGADSRYGYDIVTYRIDGNILTQLWDTHESCIEDAKIIGSTLVITRLKDADEANFSKATPCGKRRFTHKYTIDH